MGYLWRTSGPEYLTKPESQWPCPPEPEPTEVGAELRKSIFCRLTGLQDPAVTDGPVVEDCKTIEELQEQTFCHQSSHKEDKTPLTAGDYAAAEVMVLQRVQREVFPTEMACLERKFRLTPFPPPHSKCTNDPAAPHYEHKDIR
ncbi:unnamed protein product [Boreogadus saida]